MNSSADKWIIHFSADGYGQGNAHGRHHICNALAADYRILWINPVGFRFPSLRRHGFWSKIFRKLRTLSSGTSSDRPGWVVANPVLLPVFTHSPLQRINRWLLKKQLHRLMKRLDIRQPILFFSTPVFASATESLPEFPVVFYYSDAYSLYRELTARGRKYMHDCEQRILSAARMVLCCSRGIYNDVRTRTDSDKVLYWPHQVDAGRFLAAAERKTVPDDLQAIPRPIIGYYGTLTDSNDWETLTYCAKKRPQYSFVFIGRKEIADTGIEGLPNVHFPGPRPYEQIGDYGAAFDVAFMFWIRRDWIKNCSPLKLKEYLALGKPVVSTRIEEVELEYSDIVYSADSPEAFLAALDAACEGDNSDRIEKGRNKVCNDSWDNIRPLFDGLQY